MPCCGALIEFTTGFNAAVVQDFATLFQVLFRLGTTNKIQSMTEA
jgi:hypothetical protein